MRRIEWRRTVGELGALLLEAKLVKDLGPAYNRQLRRAGGLCGFVFDGKITQVAFVSNKDDFTSKAPRYKLYDATLAGIAASELTIPAESRAGPIAVRASRRHCFDLCTQVL